MSYMKCPVCGEKIEHIEDGWCNCKNRCLGSGSIDLWLNFIRTRKALDVAKEGMKEIDELLSSNRFDVKEVPLLNITQTKISMLLKCINIEQKESAFVHNKIEFPEFNDGLLEEFDKQFFENGQDDDLTETALEQNDTKAD